MADRDGALAVGLAKAGSVKGQGTACLDEHVGLQAPRPPCRHEGADDAEERGENYGDDAAKAVIQIGGQANGTPIDSK